MPKRHRKMKKGGFLGLGESSSSDSGSDSGSGSSMFGSIGSTLSGWGSSISSSASSAWNKTKSATTGAYDSATGATTPSYTTESTSAYGGRKKRSRKMRGGFKDNISTTGLAAHASPISNIKTAQPNTWVGGKTRKRARRGGKHRHSKSCKHNRKH